MSDTRYDTKIEAVFSNDYTPRLANLDVHVSEIFHDESRNVLTLVLDLPSSADVALHREVGSVLAAFEEECHLAIITEASFRYVGEIELLDPVRN